MDDNATQSGITDIISDTSEISPSLRIIIGSVTAVPIVINIFYVVVCFKELRKKFHNLLVLMLCIGDSILSLSVTLFSVTKLWDWSATNVSMCLFQIFTVLYGLVYTYSVVLLICYERYVVVKNYNFGVQNFFERFKIAIIGGTLSGGFLVTIETVLFVPHQPTITECTLIDVYGEQTQFFLTFILIGLTLIMGGVVSYSVRTGLLIWKYFFKPLKLLNADVNDSCCCGCPQCTAKTQDRNIFQLHRHEESNLENIGLPMEVKTSNGNGKQVRELILKWKAERTKSESHRVPVCTKLKKRQKLKPDAWEKRAFFTSIIIVISTIFLTGPSLMSFWLDYFYGGRYISLKTKLFLSIPLLLNSFVNPFIYAWRIPEIRLTIKKIFPCCD